LPLAAPGPFTCSADRDCRLFHRHVETNIFFHGCSPFDAWARRPVVSPYFHPIGEQPPASIVGGTDSGATRSRDYPMWTAPPSGTQVPWIRELLEPETPSTPRSTASPSSTNCLVRIRRAASTMSGYRLVQS